MKDIISEIRLRNWAKQTPYRVILAFPGSGKTTTVKQLRFQKGVPSPVDLDIKGLNGRMLTPSEQTALGELTAKLVATNHMVFSFAYYFNPDCLPTGTRVLVVLPEPDLKNAWAKRIADRGDVEFANTTRAEWQKWITDWQRWIRRYENRLNIEVAYIHDPRTYLNTLLPEVE